MLTMFDIYIIHTARFPLTKHGVKSYGCICQRRNVYSTRRSQVESGCFRGEVISRLNGKKLISAAKRLLSGITAFSILGVANSSIASQPRVYLPNWNDNDKPLNVHSTPDIASRENIFDILPHQASVNVVYTEGNIHRIEYLKDGVWQKG